METISLVKKWFDDFGSFELVNSFNRAVILTDLLIYINKNTPKKSFNEDVALYIAEEFTLSVNSEVRSKFRELVLCEIIQTYNVIYKSSSESKKKNIEPPIEDKIEPKEDIVDSEGKIEFNVDDYQDVEYDMNVLKDLGIDIKDMS